MEFKLNYVHPEEIGEYLSALSNSACLRSKEKGHLVLGIENETHKVVGTRFKPAQRKILRISQKGGRKENASISSQMWLLRRELGNLL